MVLRPNEINALHVNCKSGIQRFEQDSHPGDAVLIAPVSSQIPCYQGILQGILLFSGILRLARLRKWLSYSDFLPNSLIRLTGKSIEGAGNLKSVTGIDLD
jgi:hypothetical protein